MRKSRHLSFPVVLLGVLMAVTTFTALAAGPPSGPPAEVRIDLDNILVSTDSPITIQFALGSSGPVAEKTVAGGTGKPLNVDLTVPEAAKAKEWTLDLKAADTLLLHLVGAFPPQQGVGYSNVAIPRPGLISSVDASRPLGRLSYRLYGATFFLEAQMNALEPGSDHNGLIWVDANRDHEASEGETYPLIVGAVGKALRGIAEVQVREEHAPFRATIGKGTETLVELEGEWDFALGKSLSAKFPPEPSLHGFRPLQSDGVFMLPNLFPSVNETFREAKTPGQGWAVKNGPQEEEQGSGGAAATGFLRTAVLDDSSTAPVFDAPVQILRGGTTVFSGSTDESGTMETALAPGAYTVQVVLAKYQAFTQTATVTQDKTSYVAARLKPVSEKPSDFFQRYWFLLVGVGLVALAAGGILLYLERRR